MPLYLDTRSDRLDQRIISPWTVGKACCKMQAFSVVMEVRMDSWNESCQACGATGGPITKLSLGKDFSGAHTIVCRLYRIKIQMVLRFCSM